MGALGLILGGVALLAWRGSLASGPPLLYLAFFGSVIAYTAYQFLLKTVRPTLAASYSYVNPMVALALGAAFYGEKVAPRAVGALGLILGGVALLAWRASSGGSPGRGWLKTPDPSAPSKFDSLRTWEKN